MTDSQPSRNRRQDFRWRGLCLQDSGQHFGLRMQTGFSGLISAIAQKKTFSKPVPSRLQTAHGNRRFNRPAIQPEHRYDCAERHSSESVTGRQTC